MCNKVESKKEISEKTINRLNDEYKSAITEIGIINKHNYDQIKHIVKISVLISIALSTIAMALLFFTKNGNDNISVLLFIIAFIWAASIALVMDFYKHIKILNFETASISINIATIKTAVYLNRLIKDSISVTFKNGTALNIKKTELVTDKSKHKINNETQKGGANTETTDNNKDAENLPPN